MKSGLLKKLLLFMLLTLVVNALMTAGVFTFTSRNVFKNMKAEDMVPKAAFISEAVSQFQRGEISSRVLRIMLNDSAFWDEQIHVFSSDRVLLAGPTTPESALIEALVPYLEDILGGNTANLVFTNDTLGIVVGMPVYGIDASITGAVFLNKPLNELHAAMSGLNLALVISSLLVLLMMLVPAYFGSRSFARPLLQMSQAARAMAQGDFSVRADSRRRDEVGLLGQSLNELSETLSHTIGALVLERTRLGNVLDGLHEGIVAVDDAGAVTHCNPAACTLLKCGRDDKAIEVLRALWPGVDNAIAGAGMSTQSNIWRGDIQLQVTVTDLLDANAQRAGAVILIQDVTEQARLEQTRRDYVANVSHELRTPIASIRSLAETLNDGLVKKEEDKCRYYGYILRESMRLSRLIDDLLELSRLQSGSVAVQKKAFALQPLLQELAERFAVIAGDSGLQFAWEAQALHVYSNEDRVEQVLVALLDNATKYAQDDGRITLRAFEHDGAARVIVCNTGYMHEADIDKVFDRFYKADTAHTGQGTGLGLSITKEILAVLGERIWVENKDGEVCFAFTLQLQREGL